MYQSYLVVEPVRINTLSDTLGFVHTVFDISLAKDGVNASETMELDLASVCIAPSLPLSSS